MFAKVINNLLTMNLFTQNIKYLRSQTKLSQGKLAAAIGVYANNEGKEQILTRANIDSYERGSEPDKEGLRAIANYFSISVDDLLYSDLSQETSTQKKVFAPQITYNVIYVPTFAQAGVGRGFTDMEHYSQFPKEFVVGLADGIHYSIPIEGDSMYPTFSNGDRVICRSFNFSKYIRWGEVYVIVHAGGNLVKRIKKGLTEDTVTIVSDNDAYEPYPMPMTEIIALFIASKMSSTNLGKREILKLK